MSALVAVDLDQTVVYSRRSAGDAGPSVVVEVLDGAPLSSMTVGAVAAYRALAARHAVVPVTTRTTEQYARIALPAPAPYALCANGAVLLVDGAPDTAWTGWVDGVCAAAAPLREVEARLRAVQDAPWVRTVRTAQDRFAYLVATSREALPAGWVDGLAGALAPRAGGCRCRGARSTPCPPG